MMKLQTVSEITSDIKLIIENNFEEVQVQGEISNLKKHFSGHWYFTLKDSNAQINCTMWKTYNSRVFFSPENGMKVIVHGSVTVYPPSGNYQISVKEMSPDGEGELQAAFEKLKRKLAAEGLFDQSNKKAIPKFPKTIAIVTAEGAAALKDMLSVAERKFPTIKIIHFPVKVQGEGSAQQIASAIELLNQTKNRVDIIIVGRGGGSLEDLWAFNEEVVARAIFNSEIPIISGVGHEIDFTISDFVADYRAATPTAAMEYALPDISEILGFINEFSYNSKMKMYNYFEKNRKNISSIINSHGFRKLSDLMYIKFQYVDNLASTLTSEVEKKIITFQHKIEISKRVISNSDIQQTLKRGFLIAESNFGEPKLLDELASDEQFILRSIKKKILVTKWQKKN